MRRLLHQTIRLYVDGFRSMTLGRTLWAIVLFKLVLLFGVLRLFFASDPSGARSPGERAGYVLEQLVSEP